MADDHAHENPNAVEEMSLRPQQAPKTKKKKNEYRAEIVEHSEPVAKKIAELVDCPAVRYEYSKEELKAYAKHAVAQTRPKIPSLMIRSEQVPVTAANNNNVPLAKKKTERSDRPDRPERADRTEIKRDEKRHGGSNNSINPNPNLNLNSSRLQKVDRKDRAHYKDHPEPYHRREHRESLPEWATDDAGRSGEMFTLGARLPRKEDGVEDHEPKSPDKLHDNNKSNDKHNDDDDDKTVDRNDIKTDDEGHRLKQSQMTVDKDHPAYISSIIFDDADEEKSSESVSSRAMRKWFSVGPGAHEGESVQPHGHHQGMHGSDLIMQLAAQIQLGGSNAVAAPSSSISLHELEEKMLKSTPKALLPRPAPSPQYRPPFIQHGLLQQQQQHGLPQQQQQQGVPPMQPPPPHQQHPHQQHPVDMQGPGPMFSSDMPPSSMPPSFPAYSAPIPPPIHQIAGPSGGGRSFSGEEFFGLFANAAPHMLPPPHPIMMPPHAMAGPVGMSPMPGPMPPWGGPPSMYGGGGPAPQHLPPFGPGMQMQMNMNMNNMGGGHMMMPPPGFMAMHSTMMPSDDQQQQQP